MGNAARCECCLSFKVATRLRMPPRLSELRAHQEFFAKSHRRPMWAWDDTNLVIQKKAYKRTSCIQPRTLLIGI